MEVRLAPLPRLAPALPALPPGECGLSAEASLQMLKDPKPLSRAGLHCEGQPDSRTFAKEEVAPAYYGPHFLVRMESGGYRAGVAGTGEGGEPRAQGVLPPGWDPFEVKGGDPPQARIKAGGVAYRETPSLQWEGGQSGMAGTWSPQVKLCCGVTRGHTSQATVPCRALGSWVVEAPLSWGSRARGIPAT